MNSLWATRFSSLIAISFVCLCASAQGLPEVLKSFRKLEADTEAGLNYNEHARGMAEVNAQLKSFADNTQGRPTPPAIKALQAAFEEYKKARGAWDEQRIQDMRYQNGEMSLAGYFDKKREITAEISQHWKAAGAEIDRAAALGSQRSGSKGVLKGQ